MPNSCLEFEVIIIGAGISGLNTAYHLQNQFPDLKYTMLEARASLGGTWDLFRYPGIRSDSDLFTFGFSWHPWTASNPIAEASAIKEYLSKAISNMALQRGFSMGTTSILYAVHECSSSSVAYFPTQLGGMIRHATIRQLPEHISYDVHFDPKYKPWDQRLCVCPDGDFFKSLHKGNVQIKTDTIKQISASGIELTSGEFLDADIIVAATGLKIQFAGGIRIVIGSERFHLNEKFMWKGMMVQDLPNAALVIGYTKISWTLGADVTGILLCRLLKYLKKRNGAAIIPRVPKSMHLEQRRMLELSSTYISKAEDELPRTAHTWPWQPRINYLLDIIHAMYRRVDEALEVVC
ncbi:hypothetical protein N7450_005674 [Penicillium hetheringtonii]|uniref:Uncharacterized protein n=1 Tax=Penicillium hetheringtonii TaxID=911720 RepID=A0AAD6DJJ3_9EURO|nr:hypothetical protein N7450_005674 [Penicillium hetheringtonii]